jgi:hypothetical protein
MNTSGDAKSSASGTFYSSIKTNFLMNCFIGR